MSDEKTTVYDDIVNFFYSMPMIKVTLPDDLIEQWFFGALSEYELNINSLHYDKEIKKFEKEIPIYTQETIALMMYVRYLRRELSRVTKINSIVGKDLQLTGMDSTKRVTKAELDSEILNVKDLIHKQMQHVFGD